MNFLHGSACVFKTIWFISTVSLGSLRGISGFLSNWLNPECLVISAGCSLNIYSFFTTFKVMQRFKWIKTLQKSLQGVFASNFPWPFLSLQTELGAGEEQQLPQTRASHGSHMSAAAPKAAESPQKSSNLLIKGLQLGWGSSWCYWICSKWPKKWQAPDWGIFCH